MQPGEEHKRERVNVCTKAKRRWNRRRAHEAGAGKGGLSVDRSLLFQRLGGEKPHQRDSTESTTLATVGAPTEHQDSSSPSRTNSSGRIPGREHTAGTTGTQVFPWSQNTTLRPSSTLAQSIRGRPSRAITPQPTLISRRSSAPQPLIRSSSHFKHESCHS